MNIILQLNLKLKMWRFRYDKKTKNKMLIVFFYFLSLLIFELIIGIGKFDKNAASCVRDGNNFFALFAPFAEAGIYHFVVVSFLVIYTVFSKKIDSKYKEIIYWFPALTYIFSLPMSCLASTIVRILL